MNKQDIEEWIEENLPERFVSTTAEELAGKVLQCFQDLAPQWVSVDTLRSPWPPRDCVAQLVDAATILLDGFDYDGQGHELISEARNAADKWLYTPLPAAPEVMK